MKRILIAITITLTCCTVIAQSLQVKDLKNSIGNWKGNLTYLDYSTGKPFTMSANIKISLTENKRGYIMSYEYPKEPHANETDTIYIVGGSFGKDRVIGLQKDRNGDYVLITETKGEDGNDRKKAILRHTYTLRSKTYSIVKEVKFEGTDLWIKRNEYLFNRIDQ